ncbi:TonB family protein [Pseudogemmobacter sonorensis]|uniref:energy transducer TonB n=1 Tax=Pseudogemmobacter sonorensis TaxID=2989681 RepID=UPI0036AAA2AE
MTPPSMTHAPKTASHPLAASRCPMAPLLPSLAGPSRRKKTLAWAGSTSVAALLVSAIAAIAMTNVQTAGESMGEAAEPLIVMLPAAAPVEAMSEPAPDAVDDAPEEVVEAPEDFEEVPETPELTEAPETPDAVELPDDLLAEDVPEIDTDAPPPPVAESVVQQSPRPKPRPVREEPPVVKKEPVKTAEKPKEQPKKAPPKKSSSEASAGSTASNPSAGAASAGSGKAAAASYGSDVMKKIRRTKQRNAPGRGVTIVSFTIAPNGGLASVSVGRGSGNPALDQHAVDHVRRSAPFPAPPPGAQRSFSVEIKGR